jgi:hypothetical protein
MTLSLFNTRKTGLVISLLLIAVMMIAIGTLAVRVVGPVF